MPDKRVRAAVALPKGVHRVVSRGREYFYWQPGRNTASPGERVKLPSDPQSPEFWAALDPATQKEFAAMAREMDVIVLTEAPSDDDGIVVGLVE